MRRILLLVLSMTGFALAETYCSLNGRALTGPVTFIPTYAYVGGWYNIDGVTGSNGALVVVNVAAEYYLPLDYKWTDGGVAMSVKAAAEGKHIGLWYCTDKSTGTVKIIDRIRINP
jgi:hypothetical protein